MLAGYEIRQEELGALHIFRIALSAKGHTGRQKALDAAMAQLDAAAIGGGFASPLLNSIVRPSDALENGLAKNYLENSLKIAHFENVREKYETRHQNQLLAAETIARKVLDSILIGEMRGVHSEGGIIDCICQEAKLENKRGLKSPDSLRTAWNEYKGVAHFGAGIDLANEQGFGAQHALMIGEEIRKKLSSNCPKNHKHTYVDNDDQIGFRLISKT